MERPGLQPGLVVVVIGTRKMRHWKRESKAEAGLVPVGLLVPRRMSERFERHPPFRRAPPPCRLWRPCPKFKVLEIKIRKAAVIVRLRDDAVHPDPEANRSKKRKRAFGKPELDPDPGPTLVLLWQQTTTTVAATIVRVTPQILLCRADERPKSVAVPKIRKSRRSS